jgi:hypothetical protein
MTFAAYAPADTKCSTAVFTKQLPVAGDGTYGPVSFVASGAGSYRWIASYGGDSADSPVSGTCGDALEISLVTAPSTSPSVGSAKPPALIPGVTTVHTGEPWAGDGPIVAGAVMLGTAFVGLGLLRRRRRRLI